MTSPTRKFSNDELIAILTLSKDATAIYTSEDLVIEMANDAMISFWGKDRSVIGQTFPEAVPELVGQPFFELLRNVWRTGITYEAKDTAAQLNVDGQLQWFYYDFIYHAIKNEKGETYCILHTATDVTELHHNRLSIREGQEREQGLIEELSTTNEELAAANEELSAVNEELQQSQESLLNINGDLEEMVAARVAELQATNEELTASNEELAATNDELLAAQQRIEEGEVALRLAIDAANFGTWFIHSVTREFITDERLKELFGYYPQENLSIEQAIAQIREDYREYVATALENAIYKGGDYDVTYPVIGLHDEKLRWLRAIGNLKADPSGAFSAFTGVVMDITEPYLAAQQISAAEENLRMATESGELATWFLDEKLRKITASARFNEFFGFMPGEEVPYTAAVSQIVPEYRQMVLDAVAASFNSGAHFKVEYPLSGFHDGKKRWVRSVGKFVADEKNGNYITGVMADITEQKMDEQRKNDFIGMVSHELKTPLTSLNSYLQVLQLKAVKSGDDFISTAMDQSLKQVKKMSTMINGFLNISRLESGKINIDKQRFDMAELVKESEAETILMNSSHTFIFHPVEKTMVNADKDKIGHVIHNLISNAVKYSKTGSTIQIACLTVNGHAHFSVADEGMGIDPQHVAHIFQRYYRVKSNNNISGFGIGLYLSAEIIERHGGKIWVDSEPGRGSIFYFSLPL
jgi:PAS domain S-box-containing protein